MGLAVRAGSRSSRSGLADHITNTDTGSDTGSQPCAALGFWAHLAGISSLSCV
jgi:hypothetical protein